MTWKVRTTLLQFIPRAPLAVITDEALDKKEKAKETENGNKNVWKEEKHIEQSDIEDFRGSLA